MSFRKTRRAVLVAAILLGIGFTVLLHPQCRELRDSITPSIVWSPESVVLGTHEQPVQSLAFSLDGSLLASGGGLAGDPRAVRGGELMIWDVQTHSPRAHISDVPGGVFSMAFSPDGTTLVTGGWGSTDIQFWNAATGVVRETVPGRIHMIKAMAFPTGGPIAFGQDRDSGHAKLWNVGRGNAERDLAMFDGAFSADGRFAASVHYTQLVGKVGLGVQFHDLSSGRGKSFVLSELDTIYSLALSPGGDLLALGGSGSQVTVWDLDREQVRARFETEEGELNHVSAIQFSADGRVLAAAAPDRSIHLWELSTSRLVAVLRGHTGAIHALAFSPDGGRLASGGFDQSVRLWDLTEVGDTGP
jgi:WD40 repeat protein